MYFKNYESKVFFRIFESTLKYLRVVKIQSEHNNYYVQKSKFCFDFQRSKL